MINGSRIISPHENNISAELRAVMERHPGFLIAAVVFEAHRPGAQSLINNLPNPLLAADVMIGAAQALVRSALQAASPEPVAPLHVPKDPTS